MHILVFTQLAAAAIPVVAALAGAESIESAHTIETVLARLSRAPADVLIVEWRQQDPPTALVAAVRERHPLTALIALIDAPTTATIDSIASAGIHDIQRKPLFQRELAYRLERSIKLARAGMASLSPKRKATTELIAWTDLEALVCRDLSAMLGEPIVYQETLHEGPLFVSQISLAHGDGGVTVTFSIGLDQGSIGLLARSMLGVQTADDALSTDLVGEISNTVAGAFQRSADEEGEEITLGLPRATGRRRFEAPREGRTFVLGGSSSGVRITLAVEIRRQRIEHLRPDLLREGMVLTRDVLGDRGALLVARGTRLSQVNAERLARLLPEHSLVQVSIAA